MLCCNCPARTFTGLTPGSSHGPVKNQEDGEIRAKFLIQSFCTPLSSVQCFSDTNQMNTHNLAIVFGPTLFQTDGQDYKAGHVVEDLISHYVVVFSVRS